MTSSLPGSGRAIVASARSRSAMARRMSAQLGTMSTAVVAAMEARHEWYSELDAESRSWVGIVATSGIKGFIDWFEDTGVSPADPATVFNVAPRSMARTVSLGQAVDLIRTTVEVVEEQINLLIPRSDRQVLQTAILHYSREIAFASAQVYARAADSKVTWDDRTEAMIVDAVVRQDFSEELLSRASTLGWKSESPVVVAVGSVPRSTEWEPLRPHAETLGLSAMAAVQGDRLVVILSPNEDTTVDEEAVQGWLKGLQNFFGNGPIVHGGIVGSLGCAHESAAAAMSGIRCAGAWPEGPRILSARQLLPERALAGNDQARDELVNAVYSPLEAAGGDLLETAITFFDHSASIEASARALFVHPNTVRYRLKRIAEVTTYSPSDARDAYVLRLAITLGRLQSR